MQELDAKKSELTKIAMGLENGDVQVNQEQGTPEQILEIVEEAMEVLDEAREALPVNDAGAVGNSNHGDAGMNQVDSLIAKVKKAIDEDPADDDTDKDKDSDETKKEAKTKIATDQNMGDPDDDDDKEKDAKVRKAQEARIATLEKELNQRNRIAIVQEAAPELFPEEIRSAKVDELINSIGTNRSLEAKIKFAKDVLESQNATKTARTFGNADIFRTKKAKQQNKNVVDAWVV